MDNKEKEGIEVVLGDLRDLLIADESARQKAQTLYAYYGSTANLLWLERLYELQDLLISDGVELSLVPQDCTEEAYQRLRAALNEAWRNDEQELCDIGRLYASDVSEHMGVDWTFPEVLTRQSTIDFIMEIFPGSELIDNRPQAKVEERKAKVKKQMEEATYKNSPLFTTTSYNQYR